MIRTRCTWVTDDPLYIAYHDEEWGRPVSDDQRLFEMLILEGAQAGLSWITILRRRENYRKAFDHFNPQVIREYNQEKIEQLLTDPGIIRNRRKVESVVKNAKAFIEIQQEFGSFTSYIWQFVDGEPIVNRWNDKEEIPAYTDESTAMSKELKKRGFSFVGPTICYAFMQATGMVNDHEESCFLHGEKL